jgi:hypothetical protein
MITPSSYVKNLVFDSMVFYEFINYDTTSGSNIKLYDMKSKIFREGISPLNSISSKQKEFHIIRVSIESISQEDIIASRCLPNFTCGITFCRNSEIVGWISICFSCLYVSWDKVGNGYADSQFYKNLNKIFVDNGYKGVLE